MKSKLTLSSLIRAIVVVVFCCSTTALAATDEIEVGVTAASVTNATGKPPISPARDLETGLEVFFNEKIKTNELGRAQLLFRDGTSLTVGSGSEMTIDEYVFDPDSGAGEMVVNISKGVFRLVGGKISKNTPVVFNTKTATVTLRGGIGGITVSNEGVEAYNHFGHMTMQNKLTGLASQTFKPGNALSLKPGALTAPTKQKIDPGKLAAMSSALERPVKKPSPAAEESTPQSTEPQAPALQAEEGQAETDQAEAASTEPTAQASQEEKTDPSQAKEPGADTKMATAKPQADSEGIPAEPGKSGEPLAHQPGDENLAPKPQPSSDESLVMATPGDTTPADSEVLPSDPSTSTGLPAREGTASNGLGASGTISQGSLPTEASGIIAPSVDLTKTDLTKTPLVDTGLTTGTENLTLAPFPAASSASQPIQNLPRVDVSAMPPPDIEMNLEISFLAGKLSENVSTYIPPIGSPIGGNSSAVSREPVAMTTNLAIVVDTVTKAPGVRTDDGKSVTAPTGGYEYSTDYHFTGATKEDKPTHFKYAATTTKTCEDEKCKSVTSYTAMTTTCDPTVEYCPEPTKTFTTTSTKIDGTTTATSTTSSTTTSCDALTKCETKTYTTKPTETRTYTIEPTKAETYTIEPTETMTYTIEPTETMTYAIISSRAGTKSERIVSGLVVRDGKGTLSTSVTQANSKVEIVGNQIPLCHECRFLNWYRTTTRMASAHNSTVQIQHWIAGTVSTAAELASAASKTARYSGGLVGSVALPGQITEKLGSFDAQVRFGVSHYQVQNFNAAFDGRSYLGSSASTRNDALFNAVATSGGRVMNAQGYFFGNPARGTPPPEIGGHFQVTGGGYDAAGVFAGARH